LTSGVTGDGSGGAPNGSPAAGVGPRLIDDGSGHSLYAQIMAGYNSGTYTSGTSTVSMQWRNRSLQETDPQDGGAPASPPLQYVGSYLISNVLQLQGLGNSNAHQTQYTNANNPTYFQNAVGNTVTEYETDPFVLQMNYNAPLLSNEAGQAQKGTIFVAWLAPAGAPATSSALLQSLTAPEWLNAVTGNFDSSGHQTGVAANGRDAVANFNSLHGGGSFAAFVAFLDSSNPNGDFTSDPTVATLTPAQLSDILGSWGVDPTNHDAWTVINHNSQFAVVPEPSSLVLAALGLLGIAGYTFRRRKK
jgi:hypothetical protein